MSVDICEDSDFTYSVIDIPDSDYHHEVYEEARSNTAYGCRHEEYEGIYLILPMDVQPQTKIQLN